MKLWQSYILKRLSLRFLFILAAIYTLFIVIDYASHTSSFQHRMSPLNLKEIFLYYLFEWSRKSEIVVSFAFLLSLLSLLPSMLEKGEITLLHLSFISRLRLSYPFFLFAACLSIFLLFNQEFIVPKATNYLQDLGVKRLEKVFLSEKRGVRSLFLDDSSLLLFGGGTKEKLYSLFWIKDFNHIVRMKALETTPPAKGFDVEFFERNSQGQLIRQEIIPEMILEQFPLSENSRSFLLSPEELSISSLTMFLLSDTQNFLYQKEGDDRISAMLPYLLRKVLYPLLPLLIVLAILPQLLFFQRMKKHLQNISLSLFALLFFYLLLESFFLLAKRGTLTPFVSLVLPFLVVFLIIAARYTRWIRSS